MFPIFRPLCTMVPVVLLLLLGALPAVAGEIHQAVADGDQAKVAELLAKDPALASSPDNNSTQDLPLHVAAMQGRIEIARMLLDAGADVDGFDIDESTPLHVAALRQQGEMVDFLLANGAGVNRRDKNGAYSLSFAAWGGNAEVVSKLIDAGADLNHRTKEGLTLLHPATARGLTDLFDLLIERGADINDATDYGMTPIHFASGSGRTEMVGRLLDAGASATDPDSGGETPLLKAVIRDHVETADLLLSRGAKVDDPDDLGRTPLFIASWHEAREMADLLLRHGANPNHQDEEGKTPLWYAVQDGKLDLVQALIGAGARPDARDSKSGRTPLHLAALNGYKDIAEILIKQGAAIDPRDDQDYTPSRYAAQYGHRGVADLLAGHGSKSGKAEVNRGLAAADELAAEQAIVWNLGHSGWAIQTQNNLMIFDYFVLGRPADEPGLCNGRIVPAELNGERVTVFSSHDHGDHFDPVIFDWRDKVGDLTYVFGFRPEEARNQEGLPETMPAYEYVAPRQTQTINGMKITTIESNDTGVGFVVEVDGLVIFHAGDHANRVREAMTGYSAEIDWLADQKVRPDIAFLPISGCGFRDPEAVKEGAYYVFETLEPKLFVPMHGGNNGYVYREFIDECRDKHPKTRMYATENKGDCFLYKDGRVS